MGDLSPLGYNCYSPAVCLLIDFLGPNIHGKALSFNTFCNVGGFHLVDLITMELKDHMTSYKFKCSSWWKNYLETKYFTRFALRSECCNFNQ